VEEDVSLERAHEEQRRGAGIADAQPSRARGAAEVVGHDGEAAARRAVRLIERQYQRSGGGVSVHGHDDAAGDDALGERNELGGDAAEDQAGVDVGRRRGQLADCRGNLDGRAAVHGVVEEGVLRADVAEKRRRGDAELAGDVGQGRRGITLRGEDAAGGVDDLFAADARRAAHL
jgi:hypothetical protein